MTTKLHAIVPRLSDGRQNVTVALTVWLRRDVVRVVAWVEDLSNLHLRRYVHMMMPVDPRVWQPQLLLETTAPGGGQVLHAELETGPAQLGQVSDPDIRPFSLRFELPADTGSCFKLVEASYPEHKSPVCLQKGAEQVCAAAHNKPLLGISPSTCQWRHLEKCRPPCPYLQESLCSALAPAGRYSNTTPALWAVIGPVRRIGPAPGWAADYEETAARLVHYLSYHFIYGMSGVLLYADQLAWHFLSGHPGVREQLRAGKLRYCYDQALVASHALLGLSACGTNLMALITDLDEYLYSPQPGTRWPTPAASCLQPSSPQPAGSAGPEPTTVHFLPRFNMHSASRTPEQLVRLWATSGGLMGHPLLQYDLIAAKPLHAGIGKVLAVPAAGVVAFFVHEGVPLHGAARAADPVCLALLHVENCWRVRDGYNMRSEPLNNFTNWLLLQGGDRSGALGTATLGAVAAV
ncbi:hypothetical protein TSOC_011143, partial [Tetrabaena socialis]